jgi:hypothetical protein
MHMLPHLREAHVLTNMSMLPLLTVTPPPELRARGEGRREAKRAQQKTRQLEH